MHQSGELCYRLNGGKVTATEWRQNLGEDPYPVLYKTHKVIFLGEDGIPEIAQKVSILPPQCSFGQISDEKRDSIVKSSLLYSKYAINTDNMSAYEHLIAQKAKE